MDTNLEAPPTVSPAAEEASSSVAAINLSLHPPRFVKMAVPRAPRRHQPSKPFTWPVVQLGGRDPIVVASHNADRRGIVLTYESAAFDREVHVPVFAANDGEVSCALEGPSGCAISIDHDGTWATHYTGLSGVHVIRCLPRLRRREYVRAGQEIGYVAKSPVRIGFELWSWTDDRGFVPVDPLSHVATWMNAPASFAAVTKEAA